MATIMNAADLVGQPVTEVGAGRGDEQDRSAPRQR
jgi:hypothetical protein